MGEIRILRRIKCPRCSGTGKVEDIDIDGISKHQYIECSKCDGTGKVDYIKKLGGL